MGTNILEKLFDDKNIDTENIDKKLIEIFNKISEKFTYFEDPKFKISSLNHNDKRLNDDKKWISTYGSMGL